MTDESTPGGIGGYRVRKTVLLILYDLVCIVKKGHVQNVLLLKLRQLRKKKHSFYSVKKLMEFSASTTGNA